MFATMVYQEDCSSGGGVQFISCCSGETARLERLETGDCKPPTISMRAAQPLVGLEKRATKPVTTALGEMLAVQYTWSLVWDCH